jgi:integrase
LLSKGLAPTTTNRTHAIVKEAFKDAVRLGIISRNVLDLVKPPRYEPAPKQVLSEEQARQLLEAAKGERLQALYVLVLATGMREGELFALQWEDVDFEAHILSVNHGLQRTIAGYRMHNPKTRSSKRTIALAPHVVQALRAHRERQIEERRILGNAWDTTYDLVFPNAFGQPKKPANFIRKQFPRLLAKAGLPDIHFHDLRHTAATLLLKRGVHVKVVSEMLGHASISITLGIYAHVLPNMQRDAADMASKMFGGQDDVL